MSSLRVLVLNGPNLNLLGTREPAIYGAGTLADVESRLVSVGAELGVEVECRQSNHEGVLVDLVQGAAGHFDALIVNLGAYTHTSVALRDALAAVALPFVEVHVSNVFAREPFRHHSLVSSLAAGIVVGLGPIGYELALQALHRRLSGPRP